MHDLLHVSRHREEDEREPTHINIYLYTVKRRSHIYHDIYS